MAITVTDSTTMAMASSIGPIKLQVMTYSAASGATAGTVTATRLSRIDHIFVGGFLAHSALPTVATNVATLAFTVPSSTAATLTKGGVTYTAVATDNTGNLITVAYTAGGTAGSEVVTVVGNAISVQIESGVSTITQVRTAVNLAAAAAALVTASGTSGTAVTTATASSLSGGITGGAAGTILCLGV
jgi:hypothetical protein